MINTNKSKKLNDQQVEILYMRYMMKNIFKKKKTILEHMIVDFIK